MIRFLLLFTFVVVAFSEPIDFYECGKDKTSNCGVKAVRLSPCPKADKKNPCKLHKGNIGTLEFDFEPEFAANKLEANLYWVNALNIDVPLIGMDTDGCHSTACPTVIGQQETFKYNMTIEHYYLAMKYNVKCLLKSSDQDKCCFEFTIKIV